MYVHMFSSMDISKYMLFTFLKTLFILVQTTEKSHICLTCMYIDSDNLQLSYEAALKLESV